MISIEQAVNAIVEQINKFPNLLPTSNVRLEGVEFDGVQWRATLSMEEDQTTGARHYKTFIVDGDSGQVKSMHISPPMT
jgi:hypothetical protein